MLTDVPGLLLVVAIMLVPISRMVGSSLIVEAKAKLELANKLDLLFKM